MSETLLTIRMLIKMLLAGLSVLGIGFAPMSAGGDLTASKPAAPGDRSQYLQLAATDEGIDTWNPCESHGGYRYGPSMILNADGSLDVWRAANGPGDLVDLITYCRMYDGGASRTKEVVALKPTADSTDGRWTCDPGAVKIGDYYYIGYTTTTDPRGVANDVYVARSKTPDGLFAEKWSGDGWGYDPVPVIEYTGDPEKFGAGEPSFVVVDDTLYIYYSWADNDATTRVATADATDENWPATLTYHGECLPGKNGGDSADVKYFDEYGRFAAVFTEKRFSGDSYVAVWESFDGISFRRSGFIKNNTAKMLHNCGISGRADGHVAAGDPVYLSYAYGNDWGNWSTRMHKLSVSLSGEPKTDDTAETNVEMPVERRKDRLIPEIMTVKAEKQVYNIQKSTHVWMMAYDSDGYTFPLLIGAKYYDYDRSVIRIVGSQIFIVGSGKTRVSFRCWGFSGDFVVYAGDAAAETNE